MDHSIALRCVLQRAGSRRPIIRDDRSHSALAQQHKFALVPNTVTVANLLDFVLRQMNIKDAVKECSAEVVLPGWRTLTLNEICTDTANTTVLSLLGSVSNIAVLLIHLPVAPPPPLSVGTVRRLIRSLLPKHTNDRTIQVDWLQKSGCPLSEADLIAYLSAPSEFVFADSIRVDFAIWRWKLIRLARSQSLSSSESSARSSSGGSSAGSKDVEMEDHEGDCDDLMSSVDGSVNDETNSNRPYHTHNNNDDGESGFGDEATEDSADILDSGWAEASLERLAQLSRAPRYHHPVAVATPAATSTAAAGTSLTGKENSAAPTFYSIPGVGGSLVKVTAPRLRLFIDPHTEIPILERHFTIQPHPTAPDCRRIAEELNSMPFRQQERRQMQPKNVRLWFKNRRARARKVDTSSGLQTAEATSTFGSDQQQHSLLPILPLPSTPTAAKPLQINIRLPIMSAAGSSMSN